MTTQEDIQSVEGISQPPGGKRLLPLSSQVIRVKIRYCAASVIFIVLLKILKTLSF